MFLILVGYNKIMITTNYNRECWEDKKCPKVDCHKKPCCCGLKFVSIPAALENTSAPENGAYSNAIVRYEGSGAVYIYSAEGVPVLIKEGNAS